MFDPLFGSQDVLTVDIPVRFATDQHNAEAPVQCEAYICPRGGIKQGNDTFEHFTKMLTQVRVDHLPVPKPPTNKKDQKEFMKSNHLVCLAETEETANQLIDKAIGDILATHGANALVSLHITDQQVYNQYPMFIRARINVGTSAEEQEAALHVLKAVFRILDKVPKITVSESTRKKQMSQRKTVESERRREKEEAEQQAQLEKKRQEELEFQAKLKTLPVDQQRKLQEKRQKQELEKQKRKMMKMVKH